jgi:uncharacterized protein (TIGR03790 family)
VLRSILCLLLALVAGPASSEGLTPERLGIVYNRNDAASTRIARYYADRRHIPFPNVVGLAVPDRAVLGRDELRQVRTALLERLPSNVQSLLLVWSRPYAVECMSVTMAFAAGYLPGYCEPGCAPTKLNPLYDSAGWLPADTTGWLPAMMLPSADEALARALIDRGIRADGSHARGTVYLVRTADVARNVRARHYDDQEALLSGRVAVRQMSTPIRSTVDAAMGYFTGAIRVDELHLIRFLPGAVADHLTSTGGALENPRQMSALDWLRQGATGTYGTVTEPCNLPGKFPNPGVLMDHYLRGETLLEAYWKSVAMPGQGLFIGEPLARPYAAGS